MPATTLHSSTNMNYSSTPSSAATPPPLNELTTISVNKALDALNSNRPDAAATALRNALGYADRLLAANAVVVTANASQANEFHDYDVKKPMGGVKPDSVIGGYDLNNL